MTFYAPPDQIDQVDYAKDVGVKMLDYMEDYFNIKYPLPKAGKHSSSFFIGDDSDGMLLVSLQFLFHLENTCVLSIYVVN